MLAETTLVSQQLKLHEYKVEQKVCWLYEWFKRSPPALGHRLGSTGKGETGGYVRLQTERYKLVSVKIVFDGDVPHQK